jgi:cytochrome P450
LISALARAEQAGDQLSEDELLAMIVLLLVAGHETTVNLIGNGVLALVDNPDQLERLHNDPALIKSGVEELLRHSGPLETVTERYPREDTSVAGVTIPRGELVFAVLASANRDEQHFDNPDRLDLGREPNPHVAFGYGMHYCVGASLARLEAQIAIATLFRRFPRLKHHQTVYAGSAGGCCGAWRACPSDLTASFSWPPRPSIHPLQQHSYRLRRQFGPLIHEPTDR